MLRRNFLKSVGAMLAVSVAPAVCTAKDDSWKTGPLPLRWSDEKKAWVVDEFIQINLKKGKVSMYDKGKYCFKLLGRNKFTSLITLEGETITHHVEMMPLDDVDKVCSKDEFVKQVKRSYKKDAIYFEVFNEDKSKSNLLAFWNNG
jgi:hypothetical protein